MISVLNKFAVVMVIFLTHLGVKADHYEHSNLFDNNLYLSGHYSELAIDYVDIVKMKVSEKYFHNDENQNQNQNLNTNNSKKKMTIEVIEVQVTYYDNDHRYNEGDPRYTINILFPINQFTEKELKSIRSVSNYRLDFTGSKYRANRFLANQLFYITQDHSKVMKK